MILGVLDIIVVGVAEPVLLGMLSLSVDIERFVDGLTVVSS